jgi:hypothetical protein
MQRQSKPNVSTFLKSALNSSGNSFNSLESQAVGECIVTDLFILKYDPRLFMDW